MSFDLPVASIILQDANGRSLGNYYTLRLSGAVVTSPQAGVANIALSGGSGGGLSNPITDSPVDWDPTATPNTTGTSYVYETTTSNNTPVVMASFDLVDQQSADFTATVLARGEHGNTYAVDLRATYGRLDTTVTEVRNGATNEIGDWTARFIRSGFVLNLTFTGAPTQNVLVNAVVTRQTNAFTATPVVFNPADLPLTSYWNDSFSAVPWLGLASAGTSLGNDLDAGVSTTAGEPVNGFVPANFNGTTQYLVATDQLDAILDATGTGSFWVAFLFRADTGQVLNSSQPYNNPALLAASGGVFTIFFTTSGFGVSRYNGADFPYDIQACSVGSWHLGQVKYDSDTGLLYTRVDNGAWSTGVLSAGNMSPTSRSVTVGASAGHNIFFDGDILFGITLRRLPQGTESDDLINFVQTTYGVL